MSLNKARKRLIRKYRKLYNSRSSRPIGLKFTTDGGKTFATLGSVVQDYIPDSMIMEAGVIDTSMLQGNSITLANKEITITTTISKKEIGKLKRILR